jgi:hypothetical protein
MLLRLVANNPLYEFALVHSHIIFNDLRSTNAPDYLKILSGLVHSKTQQQPCLLILSYLLTHDLYPSLATAIKIIVSSIGT